MHVAQDQLGELREEQPEDNHYAERQWKVDVCLVVVLLGFGTCSLIAYVNQYLGLYYPYDTFLFRPDDRFGDFLHQYRIAAEPYIGASPQQMPLSYALLRALRLVPRRQSLLLFLCVFVVSVVVLMGLWTRARSRSATARNALTFLLCSYPVLITVDRANMEALVFLALGPGLWMFSRHKWAWGALMLAIAIAIKPFAFVFLLLPIARQKYLHALAALMLGAVLMLGPLLLFEGSTADNFNNLKADMAAYHRGYELGREGLFFNHSLFGIIKSRYVLIAEFPLPYSESQDLITQAKRWLPYYRVLALLLAGIVTWRLLRAPMPLWQQAALLTCSMNLLPLTSGDYRLLHFLSVLGLFVSHRETQRETQQEKQAQQNRGALRPLTLTYALLLGFLLAPRNIYHFRGMEITSAAFLTPLAMLLLVALILIETRHNSRRASTQSLQPSHAAA